MDIWRQANASCIVLYGIEDIRKCIFTVLFGNVGIGKCICYRVIWKFRDREMHLILCYMGLLAYGNASDIVLYGIAGIGKYILYCVIWDCRYRELNLISCYLGLQI